MQKNVNAGTAVEGSAALRKKLCLGLKKAEILYCLL